MAKPYSYLSGGILPHLSRRLSPGTDRPKGCIVLRSVLHIACWLGLIFLPIAVCAQDPEVQPQAPVKEEPTLYFRDKDGQLVPFPGLTLEELRRLIDIQKQIDQGGMEPLFTLERMTINGTVQSPGSRGTPLSTHEHASGFAELKIEFSARVNSDQWVRVPLRLGELILQGKPVFNGGGEQFLRFNDRRGGFDWWILGQPGNFGCTLTALVRLTKDDGDTRLQITAPRSVQPELLLTVPGNQEMGTVLGAELVSQAQVKNETQFQLAAIDGLSSLSWRSTSQRLVKSSSDLRADGFIVCQVDGQSVRTEARLKVSSFGGPFESFEVRLPPDAKLVNDDPRFHLTAVAGRKPGWMVRVLREASSNPEEVRLVTERPLDSAKPGEEIELAGFEVVGAVRQSGHIAIETADGWQVVWKRLAPSVRQVAIADLPEESQSEDFTAAFIYWRQPASLAATVLRRDTRIRVDPVYKVSVQPNLLLLEATLKYNVDGARVLNLPIDLSDWVVDDIGPESLVDLENVRYDQVRPFVIPLKQATEGKLELTLRAHLAHGGQNAPLTFTVPRPEANVLNPAQVWVVPAENVSLIPRQEALLGLVRQQIPSDSFSAARALYYRAESPQAEYVADLLVHTRRVTVDSESVVSIVGTSNGSSIAGSSASGRSAEGPATDVEQRLTYRVAYEPIAGVTLAVPANIDLQELTLDGHDADYVLLPDESSPGSMARVLLPPRNQLGTFQVVAKYRVIHDVLQGDRSTLVTVPLLQPTVGERRDSTVTVESTGLEIRPHGEQWTGVQAMSSPRGNGHVLNFKAVDPATGEFAFVARRATSRAPVQTIIEKAWYTTAYTGDVRQDRLVMRFNSTEPTLIVQLPPGVEEPVFASLDGSPAIAALAGDELVVQLGGDASRQDRLFELQYQVAGSLSAFQQHVQGAKVLGDPWLRRVYWQVILPDDQHLLHAPREVAREFHWQWQGTHWGREPQLDSQDLARWCQAPEAADFVPVGNSYLFSASKPVHELNFSVARRGWLVGAASGLLLLAGLLFLYVPLVRKPGVLFVATVALVALAALQPEIALVLAQAAALGLALALFAGILKRLLSPEPEVVRTASGPSSLISERGSTQPEFSLAPSDDRETSTMAAPLAGAVSSANHDD